MLPFGLGDMAASDDRGGYILRHRSLDAANHQLFNLQIFHHLNLRPRGLVMRGLLVINKAKSPGNMAPE
jgi:hypothetical protein